MAKRVAKFEKVSYEQFREDWLETFTWADMMAFGLLPVKLTEPDSTSVENAIKKVYDNIKLPERKSKFSAGYDFISPISYTIESGDYIKIPTGIRCRMNNDYVLQIYPRSSLGTKYMFIPMNLVGIIDSDYYDSDNEGHIFMKMKNCGDKPVVIESGDGFCQGIFVTYGITEDDKVEISRNGGMGSTNKKGNN